MSANLYNGMPPPPRRYPLGNAATGNLHNSPPRPFVPGTPPKPQPAVKQDKEKQLPEAPLPRQNAKVTPPSPPKIIRDTGRSRQFVRVGMLGEGGFARVYEVENGSGDRYACKVVTMSSLKTKKAKTKLYAEIKIHRSLEHPNIVAFLDCFDDAEHVYMTLELCHNGSLMDMLRRRRRFTEPEARFYMVQLIGACHYMHNHQVIHRDLKLGNIFLDQNMSVKVGDFGLAALIENPGERKKTICGTPNYIAPEVLFDTANGHSFEVDTWSIGVILYTLVVGRPPFQTKDVKAIYKRIRDNEYEFPADKLVSFEVQDLVKEILTPDPSQRPTLHEIIEHAFFTRGIVPDRIPTTAHDTVPSFAHITRAMSQVNLARLRRNALLDEEVTGIAVPSAPPAALSSTNASSKLKSASSSLAQQEKEFQKAVLPGSPISALLGAARQPLMVAPSSTAGSSRGEQPLIRKLQAAREREREQPPAKSLRDALQNMDEEHPRQETNTKQREKQEEHRRKELEAQKARIVAQMVPGSRPGSATGQADQDQENIPPPQRVGTEVQNHRRVPVPTAHGSELPQYRAKEKEKARELVLPTREPANLPQPAPKPAPAPPPAKLPQPATSPPPVVQRNGFDAAAQTLTAAFDAKAKGRLFRDPRQDAGLPPAKVFIVSWLDYSNKYGMGYALTDGSVGVHFNDSTSMVLSPDKIHIDYMSARRQGTVYVRKNYTASEFPEELSNKVYLLKHFEGYIVGKLYGNHDYLFKDLPRKRGMDFVQKYLRMKHVILFKLSNDVLQFNFYDHSKVILSSNGLMVTHIDKNDALTSWPLSELMAHALRPPANPEQAKTFQRLTDKLQYCKEVLVSIRNASLNSEGQAGSGADGQNEAGVRLVGAPPRATSKSSLRS